MLPTITVSHGFCEWNFLVKIDLRILQILPLSGKYATGFAINFKATFWSISTARHGRESVKETMSLTKIYIKNEQNDTILVQCVSCIFPNRECIANLQVNRDYDTHLIW